MQHRPWRRTPFQVTTLIAVALLLMILFVLVGYFFTITGPGADPARQSQQAEFQTNLELWRSRRPIAFEYIVERSCYCAPDYRRPYRVRERDDGRAAIYASPLEPGSQTVDGDPPEPVWLEDLFVLVGRALTEADEVRVSYDPAFGFPTNISIDWSQQQADEEQYFVVRDFDVIEYRD